MTTYEPGRTLTVREVLHGRPWLEFPEEVVSDDGVVLASVQVDGSPMTFFDHPVLHPWRHVDAWTGPTVLKLRRAGDWYSVWKFFDGDVFRHWYVNFETPVVRCPDRVEVNDLQLDLVVTPDGEASWKDVHHLAPCLDSGRITLDEVTHVLAAAADVTDLLDRDDRWWSPWDCWSPGTP
jgi:hypothetical protein